MADLIDRQTAIETAIEAADKWDGGYSSEREEIIRKFFDKVPAAQPTCKPECKRMYSDVSDTISRQAAIDAVDVLCQEHRYRIPGKRETYSQYNEAWQDALDRAEVAIGNLPSVQPDHNADIGKKVEGDCISRQMAIDALFELYEYQRDIDPTEAADLVRQGVYLAEKKIEQLPSVQPDEIPLEWIDKHLEWLDNCDNDFAQLAKVSIKAMVELWKKDRI